TSAHSGRWGLHGPPSARPPTPTPSSPDAVVSPTVAAAVALATGKRPPGSGEWRGEEAPTRDGGGAVECEWVMRGQRGSGAAAEDAAGDGERSKGTVSA